jgi:hypothetical protein
MAPHVHVGLVEFVTVVAYIVIFTFLWRVAAAHINEKNPTLAGAMTAVYS